MMVPRRASFIKRVAYLSVRNVPYRSTLTQARK